jgi:hypothetical protein
MDESALARAPGSSWALHVLDEVWHNGSRVEYGSKPVEHGEPRREQQSARDRHQCEQECLGAFLGWEGILVSHIV